MTKGKTESKRKRKKQLQFATIYSISYPLLWIKLGHQKLHHNSKELIKRWPCFYSWVRVYLQTPTRSDGFNDDPFPKPIRHLATYDSYQAYEIFHIVQNHCYD